MKDKIKEPTEAEYYKFLAYKMADLAGLLYTTSLRKLVDDKQLNYRLEVCYREGANIWQQIFMENWLKKNKRW